VGAPGGGGTSQFDFGVDPSLDPELAMVRFPHSFFQQTLLKKIATQALRMSMEEEAARQAAANPPPPPESDAAAPAATGPDGAAARPPPQPAAAVAAPATDENEEALLQQALAMSEDAGVPEVEMTTEEHGGADEDLTEEEMIERAIQMSMQPEAEPDEKKK
jgi:26S proteasome regulatory subunit N10